ncbi:MAG: RidA family protein [Dehalococcoidia bacterium]|nr:RidA family protein [Dehalococcoidia bacterium]
MLKKSFRVFHGGKLMPWATGTLVEGARGIVWLSGAEGRHPDTDEVVEGAYAQAIIALEKIKSRLEEFGTSLDNIVEMNYYIRGDFPDGVRGTPLGEEVVRGVNDFFKEHYPAFCWDKNPPTGTLLGVSGLAKKGMLVEIAVTAVVP